MRVYLDNFGYLDTERFVAMMGRSPEDYMSWHQRHFAKGESVRELGEKNQGVYRLKATDDHGITTLTPGTELK